MDFPQLHNVLKLISSMIICDVFFVIAEEPARAPVRPQNRAAPDANQANRNAANNADGKHVFAADFLVNYHNQFYLHDCLLFARPTMVVHILASWNIFCRWRLGME